MLIAVLFVYQRWSVFVSRAGVIVSWLPAVVRAAIVLCESHDSRVRYRLEADRAGHGTEQERGPEHGRLMGIGWRS